MMIAWPVLSTVSEVCAWIDACEYVLHRLVEAARLVAFVVEIFDRLVVQQAVDRLGVRVLIALVHVAAELDAPARDREGEPDIERRP